MIGDAPISADGDAQVKAPMVDYRMKSAAVSVFNPVS